MRPIILPYKLGSKGGKELARYLRNYRSKRVRVNGNYRPFRNHLIINWGNQHEPSWFRHPRFSRERLINPPDAVYRASNKLLSFEVLDRAAVPIPEFTASLNEARSWLSSSQAIVERNVLRGSRGIGIRIRHEGDELRASCPLFVKYFKKRYEWRVHVFRGEVISLQQKRRRTNHEADYSVRTHANGWVFCRDTITGYRPEFGRLAIDAVSALGLDFGAVDMVYNSHYDRAVVLEVNTAPGLEGGSIEIYGNAIRRLL